MKIVFLHFEEEAWFRVAVLNFTEFAHYFCEALDYGMLFLKFLGSVLSILLFGPCLSFISVVSLSLGSPLDGSSGGSLSRAHEARLCPFQPLLEVLSLHLLL